MGAGKRIKGQDPPENARSGTIVTVAPSHIEVIATNSVVNLTELQRPGGKRLKAADFLRGTRIAPGMCFESATRPPLSQE